MIDKSDAYDVCYRRAKIVAQNRYAMYLEDMTKAYSHPIGSYEWTVYHAEARASRTLADRAVWIVTGSK